MISTPLEDLPYLPTWTRLRAVLLGDGGHEPLAAYERARQCRAEWVAPLSTWTGRMAQVANPGGRTLRNGLLRRIHRKVEDRQAELLYAAP